MGPPPPLVAMGAPATFGSRWTGNLGPSLFLTAVERRGLNRHGESERERLGRRQARVAIMRADQRALNDLPPAQPLREALASPVGRFADLLAEGLREGLERGDAATRAHCQAALGDAAATALVPGAKSAQGGSPHGFKGLTTAGRRSVRDAGAVLDDSYGTLGFFTVTLTPATSETATREQIAVFQSRLMFLIRRRLCSMGLPPLVLLVAEMHPHRRAMDGAPVPHWHGVVKVSRRPYETWTFRKEHFNRAVLQAYRIAFGHKRGHTQRLQLMPQRTGAARYLAKYMSKERSNVVALQGEQQGRMVPRQWWTWTGELRALVTGCRVRPPSGFLRWCCRWWQELSDLGEITSTGLIQIGDQGPVVGRWMVWASEAALDRAIEGWIGETLALRDWVQQCQGGVAATGRSV